MVLGGPYKGQGKKGLVPWTTNKEVHVGKVRRRSLSPLGQQREPEKSEGSTVASGARLLDSEIHGSKQAVVGEIEKCPQNLGPPRLTPKGGLPTWGNCGD